MTMCSLRNTRPDERFPLSYIPPFRKVREMVGQPRVNIPPFRKLREMVGQPRVNIPPFRKLREMVGQPRVNIPPFRKVREMVGQPARERLNYFNSRETMSPSDWPPGL